MVAVAESPTVVLDRKEILARIDVGARERRGMTARTLLRSYRDGRLDDPGSVADLLVLSDLLDEDDPILAQGVLIELKDRTVAAVRRIVTRGS